MVGAISGTGETSTARLVQDCANGYNVLKYTSMSQPSFSIGPEDSIESNRGNGEGYWLYTPYEPQPVGQAVAHLSEHSDFTEVEGLSRALAESRTVLIQGAPGAGKSHLVRDLQTAAVASHVPTLAVQVHVNGGKRDGAENLRPVISQFKEIAAQTGGLVILDNVDFLGYRGSRKRGESRDYAASMEAVVQELVDDPNLVVIGVAHDERWRQNRWSWDDSSIDGPARRTVEAFSRSYGFEGRMALVGLTHILRERNLAETGHADQPVSLDDAARVMRRLHETGHADFFHANHLSIAHYLSDPDAALQQLHHGREDRYGRASR